MTSALAGLVEIDGTFAAVIADAVAAPRPVREFDRSSTIPWRMARCGAIRRRGFAR